MLVDATGITSCARVGVAILIEAARRCRRDGVVLDILLSPQIARTLADLGLGPGGVAECWLDDGETQPVP
jgi:ABC-type transporter Mla MlaB component